MPVCAQERSGFLLPGTDLFTSKGLYPSDLVTSAEIPRGREQCAVVPEGGGWAYRSVVGGEGEGDGLRVV